MKGDPTLPRFAELKPYHQIRFTVISRTPILFGWGNRLVTQKIQGMTISSAAKDVKKSMCNF